MTRCKKQRHDAIYASLLIDQRGEWAIEDKGEEKKIAIILQKITYVELITTLLEFIAHKQKKNDFLEKSS